MRFPIILFTMAVLSQEVTAQTDTISTSTPRLLTSFVESGKKSYAVFFTDSLGNRTSSADLWDREVAVERNQQGQPVYTFHWKWYKADTLALDARAICSFPSLKPVEYTISRSKKKPVTIVFENQLVTIHAVSRKTLRDTTYQTDIHIPAYDFPMDMEVLSLLPFKKEGQKFIIPFYEPGTAKADWYPCTLVRSEDLVLPGHSRVSCWVIRLDYNTSGSSATFWITKKDRDLIKMQSYFKGRYRYKVKLY